MTLVSEALVRERAHVSRALVSEARNRRPRPLRTVAGGLGVSLSRMEYLCPREYRTLVAARRKRAAGGTAAVRAQWAQVLSEEISSESPRWPTSVAKALGIARETLKEACPEFVSELVRACERARERRRVEEARALVALLESALEESPAPSVASLCARESVTRWALKSSSEEFYDALVSAHRAGLSPPVS